ncbi:monofunctional biosynthetic peptidoglycan transglycosylase [Myxococcaceae bacterium GXIMD 01537]
MDVSAHPEAAGKDRSAGPALPRRALWKRALLGAAALLLGGVLAYEYVALPDAESLRTDNPKTTALIEQRAAEARADGKKPRRRQSWVPLSAISKPAVNAVLISEDSGFYLHEGVDTAELEKALEEAWEKRRLGRGASTITQQLAKNLWLSTDRSLLRKAKELVLARRLEDALPKNRILTLYLNVVEWGPGVYGIEAAAREHFAVSAAKLTVSQGAILASMLPAPRKRSVGSHSKALRQRAHWVVDQMKAAQRISPEQAQAAHDDIDERLGWKNPPEDGGADGAEDDEP